MIIRKSLLTAVAGLGLAIATSTAALAGPTAIATFNPIAYGGTGKIIADQMTGVANDVIHFGAGGATFTETGALQISGFTLGGNPVNGKGLTSTYNVFVTLTSSGFFTGVSGGVASYALTSLNYNVIVDAGGNAFRDGVGSVNLNANGDALTTIANGSLLFGTASESVIGGPALNSFETFNALLNGPGQFLEAPVPFFQVAFDSFNSTPRNVVSDTSNGGTTAGDLIINGQVGNINFVVPEPGTLALFGVSLLGMGVIARRRRGDIQA